LPPSPGTTGSTAGAFSVFIHLVTDWAEWVLELHRALRPDGLLVASFLGEGMIELENGGRWDPDRIGMNVLRAGQDWDGGCPTAFHSDWWVRAHWGRAFEVLAIDGVAFADRARGRRGMSSSQIGRGLGGSVATVRTGRNRFAKDRLTSHVPVGHGRSLTPRSMR
jgi:hypothetical protein